MAIGENGQYIDYVLSCIVLLGINLQLISIYQTDNTIRKAVLEL